jgi:hypothetical protein
VPLPYSGIASAVLNDQVVAKEGRHIQELKDLDNGRTMSDQLQLGLQGFGRAFSQHEQLQSARVDFGYGRQIKHQAGVRTQGLYQRSLEFVGTVDSQLTLYALLHLGPCDFCSHV